MKHTIIFLICLVTSRGASVLERSSREIKITQLNNRLSGDNEGVQIAYEKHQDTSQTQTYEEVMLINKICMEVSGVDKQIIKNVLKTALVPKSDPKYLKFLACSYKKQKYLNEKGEIQFQNIKKFLSKYYSLADLSAIDSCKELKQTDYAGQNAYNALECILPKLVPLVEKN
ncbi:hypothetical protein WA026_015744 [Henosepilachna vigintioctopunctata]|uniref:Uncharacterized protein n=1 Tax=Henosepilachna vigintioctopunctata TaxID=420089 RepID=A0AAW1UUP6_9CUCU